MQVIHGLAAVFTRVDDHSIALTETLFLRDIGCDPEKMAQKIAAIEVDFVEREDVLARNDQDGVGACGCRSLNAIAMSS